MDSQARSIAKTASWRVVATVMTFGISYIWLNDITSSLGLAIAANLLKTLAYYMHERGWNALSWGRTPISETRLRSVGKSLSWRLIASVITLAVSYIWLNDIKDSVSFVSVAMTVKVLLYYLHERGWNALSWGKGYSLQIERQESIDGAGRHLARPGATLPEGES